MARAVRFSTTVLFLWLTLVAGSTAQLLSGKPSSLLSSDRPQPLPIDSAFPFFVSLNSDEGLTVNWQPAADHYLYRHRFAFALKNPDSAVADPIVFSLPDGLKKWDEFFGDIEAYYDNVSATLELPANPPAGSVLEIRFQGCADWGFCYAPQSVDYPLTP